MKKRPPESLNIWWMNQPTAPLRSWQPPFLNNPTSLHPAETSYSHTWFSLEESLTPNYRHEEERQAWALAWPRGLISTQQEKCFSINCPVPGPNLKMSFYCKCSLTKDYKKQEKQQQPVAPETAGPSRAKVSPFSCWRWSLSSWRHSLEVMAAPGFAFPAHSHTQFRLFSR